MTLHSTPGPWTFFTDKKPSHREGFSRRQQEEARGAGRLPARPARGERGAGEAPL